MDYYEKSKIDALKRIAKSLEKIVRYMDILMEGETDDEENEEND